MKRPADPQTQLSCNGLVAEPQQIDDALVARAELAHQRRIERKNSRAAADCRRSACGSLPSRRLDLEEGVECIVQLGLLPTGLKSKGCGVLGKPVTAPQIASELAGHGLRR